MSDSTKPEVHRIAALLADGVAVDWAAIEASGALTAEEIRALRILEDVSRPMAPPVTPADDQELPRGFEIRGELGRGSMGQVWRAFDRALSREVALKVIHAESAASAQARASFLEEARLLARLRHPNVVHLHSIDEHEGRIRLVLERIEGRNLAQVVQEEGPLAPREAARIGIELCRALAALHSQGIVHRDLKPTNVMREQGGRVVLLDFGVARSASSRRVLASDSAGTPRFMAPEQFEGRSEVGPAADVWALGALLYWLVSARFPFEGSSYEELEQNVRAGRCVPLLDRRPDVPLAFAEVVRRALEREPARRFESAGEMEQELRIFLAAAPVESAGPSRPDSAEAEQARRRVRNRWMGAIGAIAALAVFAVLGWTLRSTHGPLAVDCELYAHRAGSDVRLRSGDATHIGDMLALEFSAPEEVFAYVLDEDDTGDTHVLFPAAGFEPPNPLARGRVHRLPGSWQGQPQRWVVTSAGGAENILVVASRGPFAPLEQLIAGLPRVQPGAQPVYPEVTPENRGLVLRGISGTVQDPAPPASISPGGRLALLEQVFALLDRGSNPDISVRLIRLRHGP